MNKAQHLDEGSLFDLLWTDRQNIPSSALGGQING